jgi:molybdopterin/thiamine biosynthesis adenylyltransferase
VPHGLTNKLWASAGQRSLETARILLIGSDATGCQALKNLVLPGELRVLHTLLRTSYCRLMA